MKKIWGNIKKNAPPIIAILLIIILLVVICVVSEGEAKTHSAFGDKGTGYCPVCGAKLVKGVWGAYSPHFIWYCPDCP